MNLQPNQMKSCQKNQNKINNNTNSYISFNNNSSSNDKFYTNQPNNDKGDAPPPPFYENNQINSTGKIIGHNADKYINLNKKSDLNQKNTEISKKEANNIIDPNIGYNKDLYINKVTQNISTTKGEVNPNFGKGNMFHISGNYNNIGNNNQIDNNIGNNNQMDNNNPIKFGDAGNNSRLDNEKTDSGKNKQNLDDSLEDIKKSKIKRIINQKIKEGYFPLFIKMDDQKPFFYYMKPDQNLKILLKVHLNNIKIDDLNEENYFFYNNGEVLNPEVPIQNLDIKILSVIEIHHFNY